MTKGEITKVHTVKIVAAVIVLLAVVVGISVYSTSTLSISSKRLESQIEQIESTAKAGKWDEVKDILTGIEKDWAKTEKSWATLIDHAEIDNIGNAISRMSRYMEEKNSALALGEAASLKLFIKHIPDKEAISFKNIF